MSALQVLYFDTENFPDKILALQLRDCNIALTHACQS